MGPKIILIEEHNMTKILVTGATGHLGGQTVDFLLDRVPARKISAGRAVIA